ncbi:hypothetical protein [Niabella ginsenosidivorans]|nr:hypothetical protein [Niabella ginsenosidivorans]
MASFLPFFRLNYVSINVLVTILKQMPVITIIMEDFTKGHCPAVYRQVRLLYRSALVKDF